jgi:hypothetical protein
VRRRCYGRVVRLELPLLLQEFSRLPYYVISGLHATGRAVLGRAWCGRRAQTLPLKESRYEHARIYRRGHTFPGEEEKFFARVDVTEEFPYLVTKMSPYYDR